jgi:two-component system sensor kinase FixL
MRRITNDRWYDRGRHHDGGRHANDLDDGQWIREVLGSVGDEPCRISDLLTDTGTRRQQVHDGDQRRFRSLMDTSSDAVFFVDQENRVLHCNKTAERMFGYSSTALAGLRLEAILSSVAGPDPEPPGTPGSEATISEEQSFRGRRLDGTDFPATVSAAAVVPESESLVIIRDETHLRRLECEVLEAAAIECRRIGQDLHDVTGQELTALSLIASGLAKMLASAETTGRMDETSLTLGRADFRKVRETVGSLRQGLADAAKHAQDLSHGILPFPIEPTELEERLQALCEMISGLRSVHCRVSFPPEVRHINSALNCDTSTQLYRIVQEAVTNAVRHGQADEIHIALKHDGSRLTLEIQDNGKGIQSSQALRNGAALAGAGLRNMEYRARQIGGILETESPSGGGTVVRCVVQIRDNRND